MRLAGLATGSWPWPMSAERSASWWLARCAKSISIFARRMLRKKHGELPELPVLYLTQLLGLALGLSAEEVGLDALSVSAQGVLQRLEQGVLSATGSIK